MSHFDHLGTDVRDRLFHREPRPLADDAPVELRAVALGATLYCPGTRPALADDLIGMRGRGVAAAVVCLEDAVADEDLPAAEANVVAHLTRVHDGRACVPRLFLRVRRPDQITDLIARLGPAADALEGFVLPKFTAAAGVDYLDRLAAADSAVGRPLMAMPVVESPEVIHLETRLDALRGIAELLAAHRDRILAVRIGAADLSGIYGLRRPTAMTVYDVRVVAGVISDVVNVFGRDDGTGFVISGPAWEYFDAGERIFQPRLRSSVFDEHGVPALRDELLHHALDGLIREVELDKANGLTGKTVIHPSHIGPVHALSVVSHEEYSDACAVLGRTGPSGVLASEYANKMNEVNPHRGWARRTLARADVFGVAAPGVSFVDFLAHLQ